MTNTQFIWIVVMTLLFLFCLIFLLLSGKRELNEKERNEAEKAKKRESLAKLSNAEFLRTIESCMTDTQLVSGKTYIVDEISNRNAKMQKNLNEACIAERKAERKISSEILSCVAGAEAEKCRLEAQKYPKGYRRAVNALAAIIATVSEYSTPNRFDDLFGKGSSELNELHRKLNILPSYKADYRNSESIRKHLLDAEKAYKCLIEARKQKTESSKELADFVSAFSSNPEMQAYGIKIKPRGYN